MADPTNPNDPDYANNPNFVFAGGRWQYRGDPNAAPGPEGHVQGSTERTATPGEFWSGLADAANRTLGNIGDVARGSSFDPGLLRFAPGSDLNTDTSQEDAARFAPFIQQLQQQAQTGGGAWESALKDSVEGAQASAASLGQAQSPQTGYGESLRRIGNAQGAAAQEGVGEGNILRAQTQQNAQQQLANIFANQQANESAQATQQGGARQGVRGAMNSLASTQRQNTQNFISGAGQAITSLFSEGGTVPGEAEVFGDDEANDTVPAMLSAGEIVIPRSIALSDDPVRRSAEFVAAIKAKGQHYDDGGQIPLAGTGAIPDVTAAPSKGIGLPREAASIANGAVLDANGYNAARAGALGNIGQLGASAMGGGPSVAPQLQQNARDAAMAQALSGQKLAPGALTGVASNQVRAGGDIAGQRAQEQARAMSTVADTLAHQRAQDLAFAKAQQEALWRNSMMNAGIDLQNMAALRGILSGAGQAVVSLADRAPTGTASGDSGDNFSGYDTGAIDAAFNEPFDSGAGDFNGGDGGAQYAADGGEIKAKKSRRALRRDMHEDRPRLPPDQGNPDTDFLPFPKDKQLPAPKHYFGTQTEEDQMLSRGGEVKKARDFLRAMRAA